MFIARRFRMADAYPPCPDDTRRDCPLDLDLLQGVRDMNAFRRVGTILSGLLTAGVLALAGWLAGLQAAINDLRGVDADRGARMIQVETNTRSLMSEMASQGRTDATQQEAIQRLTDQLARIDAKLDRLLERQNGGK